MKQFFLALLLILLPCTILQAAYPYDSICEVRIGKSGGSGTLIAVSQRQALILSCQHVTGRVGRTVRVNWSATGEKSNGKVFAVGSGGLDIALIVCPKPTGLQPVPVTIPSWASTKKIINAGFPGLDDRLEWQTGRVIGIDVDELRYSCRPVPGMSGGATLDQNGNLVGVITRYGPRYGISTSGTAMMSFVGKFMKTTKVETWKAGIIDYSDVVPDGPEDAVIVTPKDWNKFLDHVFEEYILPFRESVESEDVTPDLPGATEPEDTAELHPASLKEIKKQVRKPKKKQRRIRRLFRRRS